jgi:antitoxin (DNA-binding transcriptional repressor) of toxin-antitoxin stability system
MRTASIREVRHDLGRILEWVADGEEVAITKRRQTVARLVPAVRGKRKPVKMPDVAARLQKVFGNKVISDRDMRHLWAENRGEY